MGIFSRRKSGGSNDEGDPIQPPDECGRQGQLAYGNTQFVAAVEAYAAAIDKLHTMYVMGGMRMRQPSAADTYILDGLVSSIGAARAMNAAVELAATVEKPLHYLGQIVESGSQAGYNMSLYEAAIRDGWRELSQPI